MQTQRRFRSDGSQMMSCLNPNVGTREKMRARGVEPPNHMKDNARSIKRLEAQVRARRDKENEPKEPEWKIERFKHVPSKLAEMRAAQAETPRSREGGDYLHRGTAEQKRIDRAKEMAAKARAEREQRQTIRSPRKPSIPKPTDLAELAPRNHTNYVHENIRSALQTRPDSAARRRLGEEEQPAKHAEFGRVPEYLQRRRVEEAEAEQQRLASLPDPDCPPGMVRMPEEERLDTLRVLQAKEEEIRQALAKMPLIMELPSQKRRLEAFESKLREIEEAKKIFSRQKVFIMPS